MNNTSRHFDADFTLIENGIILSMKGALDAGSSLMAINILERILESGVSKLVLDCSQLHQISSAGIGVILSAYHLSLDRHKVLILFGLQPDVFSMFEALGMDKVLHITNTKEEALAPTLSSRLA